MASVNDEGGYGRFGVYSRVELERFFHLDDEDPRLVAARRRDHNRPGFALQVVAVRHPGMFVPRPLDVAPKLVEYLAGQLGFEDPSCVNRCTDREKSRLEHAWEIRREHGPTPFADVGPELGGVDRRPGVVDRRGSEGRAATAGVAESLPEARTANGARSLRGLPRGEPPGSRPSRNGSGVRPSAVREEAAGPWW